jgi:hypothetical protein
MQTRGTCLVDDDLVHARLEHLGLLQTKQRDLGVELLHATARAKLSVSSVLRLQRPQRGALAHRELAVVLSLGLLCGTGRARV